MTTHFNELYEQPAYGVVEVLEQYAVREFVFTSGNMSGQEMAQAMELAIPKMIRLAQRYRAALVASITRIGDVHLRWPRDS
jgi:hypothetical protein